MSLIKDIKNEVNELDLTEASLKKGGATLGITLIVIATTMFYLTSYKMTGIYLNVIGTALTFLSILVPNTIKSIYKVWMIFALVLGWFVSKIIFTIIFYLVVAPIGFVAKLVGKEFLDLKFSKKATSYWIKKSDRKIDYEKMH
ncbi:MAG: hypothetical protein IPJ75_13535 [Ignavibacteriales bacterium]|nr:hypothetical protein [Ignavibacteriales bacterium]